MPRVVHIIGNGDNSRIFLKEERKGLKITCNLPPFTVADSYGTCIVDFKMMIAITKGEIQVPGEWILGARPKKWMETNPGFYMKASKQVKEFYLNLPKYSPTYTDFNCGHMATHYSCTKFKPDEVNLYGFDSLFDFNLKSCTDFYLPSARDANNSMRLANRWRPIWQGIFGEFKNVNFILHHNHNNIKFDVPENVSIKVTPKK